jgi:hypothetical protein
VIGEAPTSGVEAFGVYRTIGIPVVEGLTAIERGAYAKAVELLARTPLFEEFI